jgi:hypothetical protein
VQEKRVSQYLGNAEMDLRDPCYCLSKAIFEGKKKTAACAAVVLSWFAQPGELIHPSSAVTLAIAAVTPAPTAAVAALLRRFALITIAAPAITLAGAFPAAIAVWFSVALIAARLTALITWTTFALAFTTTGLAALVAGAALAMAFTTTGLTAGAARITFALALSAAWFAAAAARFRLMLTASAWTAFITAWFAAVDFRLFKYAFAVNILNVHLRSEFLPVLIHRRKSAGDPHQLVGWAAAITALVGLKAFPHHPLDNLAHRIVRAHAAPVFPAANADIAILGAPVVALAARVAWATAVLGAVPSALKCTGESDDACCGLHLNHGIATGQAVSHIAIEIESSIVEIDVFASMRALETTQ